MKKKFFSLLLTMILLIMSCMLTSCGGEKSNIDTNTNNNNANTNDEQKNNINSSEKITVTYYTLNEEDKSFISKLVPDFEKAHSNIKVKIITSPYDQFDTKMQTMIAGGTAPDVTSHFGDAGFIEFYNKGLLMDLTPFMEEDNYDPVEVGIPKGLVDIYKINGKQYGIPVNSYVSVLAYNKDMFDKAGLPYPPSSYEDKSWTFDKMIEYAKKLTKISSNVTESEYGVDWAWSEPDMRPVYFGAKVYSDDTWTNGGHVSKCYFDSNEVISAYQKLADLIWKDKVQPTAAISKGIAGQSGEVFAFGKVGMSVSGAWCLAGSEEYGFKVGVAAVPIGGDPKVRDVLYVDPLFILKGCKHPKEAFEWIKYQIDPEVQKKAIKLSGGNPPANLKAAESYYNYFSGIDPQDMKNVVEGGIKYGVESYNHIVDNYSQIWTVVKNETDPMFSSGKKSSAQIAPELQNKVTQLLDKLNSK